MPAVAITPADLEPFADIPLAKAEEMITDAVAQAWLVAPCIVESNLDVRKAAAAKAILRGAILRWHEAGTGALQQHNQVAGPFQNQQMFDTRQPRRSLFWPSEITQLEQLCKADSSAGGAWSYDTVASVGQIHADVCALNLGANYCSCGAIYAGVPLWETNGQ